MAHGSTDLELPFRRLETTPRLLATAAPALIVIGLIALLAALAVDPARGWRAYYINWLYFLGIAQGAFLLSVLVTIAKGIWSQPVRRFSLAFAAFLPLAYLTVLPILFLAPDQIWPWLHEPLPPGKEAWLNLPFLQARTLVGLAALFGISIAFAYHTLRPDLGLVREQVPPSLQTLYARLTRGWRGQEAEELHAFRHLSVLAPATVLVYALVLGVLTWDFVMSLEPHWFSTLIGPYFFMGAFLTGLMTTGIVIVTARAQLGLQRWIPASALHDLGKLAFGFTVFWAYLFFSQFIVIWYGLLPLEQTFVIHRFSEPYILIAQLVGLLVFVVPFFGLMGVVPKRTPALFVSFALVSLLGMWLERYILVYPSLYIGGDDLPLGWQEPAIFLFFLGLLLLSLTWFLRCFPMFQLWQPPSELELQGVHLELSQQTADIR